MSKAFKLSNGQLLLSTEAPGGVYSSAQLKKIAALCDGDSALAKATEDQRLALFVAPENAAKVAAELKSVGLGVRHYQDGMHQPINCLGEMCPEHLQDAMATGIDVAGELAAITLEAPLKIGINGCARCCLATHTLDISIIGDSGGYRISLGGKNSQIPEMASFMAEGVPADELPKLIAKVVSIYKKTAQPGESLQEVIERTGSRAFIDVLAPYSQDAHQEDPFPGTSEETPATEAPAEDSVSEEETSALPSEASLEESDFASGPEIGDDLDSTQLGAEPSVDSEGMALGDGLELDEHSLDLANAGEIASTPDVDSLEEPLELEALESMEEDSSLALDEAAASEASELEAVEAEPASVASEDAETLEPLELADEAVEPLELAEDNLELKDESLELKDDSLELEGDNLELGGDNLELKDESQELKDDSLELADDDLELADEPAKPSAKSTPAPTAKAVKAAKEEAVGEDDLDLGSADSIAIDDSALDNLSLDEPIHDTNLDELKLAGSADDSPTEELALDDTDPGDLTIEDGSSEAATDFAEESLSPPAPAKSSSQPKPPTPPPQAATAPAPAKIVAAAPPPAEGGSDDDGDDLTAAEITEDEADAFEKAINEQIAEEESIPELEDANSSDRLEAMQLVADQASKPEAAVLRKVDSADSSDAADEAPAEAANTPPAAPVTPLKAMPNAPSVAASSAFEFTGLDVTSDGKIALQFASGAAMEIDPVALAQGKRRELKLAGKSVVLVPRQGGIHVEVDGVGIFLPQRAAA